jgi:oligopeptide transport system substrate-binding protein
MSSVNQRSYEIAILTESGSYNDYEYALGGFRSDAGLFNVTGYASDTFDALFKRGSVATDVAVRRDFMQRAERTLAQDFPFIPLEFGVLNRVINPRLRGPVATQSYPQTRLLSFEP